MAVLSKIRQLPIILLIIIIGLPLLTFVMDPSALTDFFNAKKINSVGQVAGEPITRQEFAKALDTYRTQSGGRVSEMQAAKNVWDNLVKERIYKAQLEEAGITIGEADIMNKLYETRFIQDDPRFKTEGVFDKSKLKTFLATKKDENSQEWANWRGYMASIKANIEKTTYDNLIAAGLGASLKEGKAKYMTDNTKVTADLVYLPYDVIADSTVSVTKSQIESYLKAHENEFQVEASRDISYVKFPIVASAQDEEVLKTELTKLIDDRQEYSAAAKTNVTVKGFKNATNYKQFFDDNKSDLPYNKELQFKVEIPVPIVEKVYTAEKGAVFGPYKDREFYKLSKVVDIVSIPDSVKARHILIPFKGTRSAKPETTTTEEQAKQTADSLATIVKATPSSFAALAKEFSADKVNSEKGGELGWFTYRQMVSNFRDYCFENKVGDIGVIKTEFGYHVIKIDEQTTIQKAIRLATFARKIEASEATENSIFQKAESFALEVSKGKSIDELAKQGSLKAEQAVALKALDEDVPGLGKERQIISWTFEKEVNQGSYKRFDVDGGYVVAVLTNKTNKGLMPYERATTTVRPILVNEKKAEILKGQLVGESLDAIAKSAKQTVRKANGVSLSSPTISGIGFEPSIVGAMLNAKEGQVYKHVAGNRGVFCFSVVSKKEPVKLPNYNTERKRIVNLMKSRTHRIYDAIKKSSDIEDYLSSFYGIE